MLIVEEMRRWNGGREMGWSEGDGRREGGRWEGVREMGGGREWDG